MILIYLKLNSLKKLEYPVDWPVEYPVDWPVEYPVDWPVEYPVDSTEVTLYFSLPCIWLLVGYLRKRVVIIKVYRLKERSLYFW